VTGWFALKAIHVVAMAVWFGAPFAAKLDVEESIARGQSTALVARLRRTTTIVIASALTTVGTGAALMWLAGGWSRAPHRIQLGLILTLLTFVIGATVMSPAIAALDATERGRRALRRFTVGHWVEITIRTAVLLLMVVPFTF
jgi:hypothetical protein